MTVFGESFLNDNNLKENEELCFLRVKKKDF